MLGNFFKELFIVRWVGMYWKDICVYLEIFKLESYEFLKF